jgi:hypothetical protein
MANLILGIFLVVFGLNLLFALAIPLWVTGVLALVAGLLFLADRFRIRMDRK